MDQTPNATHFLSPMMRLVAATIAGLILAGTAWAGVSSSNPAIALAGVVVVAGTASLYASATRQRWAKLSAVAHVILTAAALGVSVVGEQWVWAAVSAVAGAALWFAGRTMRQYLRPGAEMPTEVLGRIENLAMLSGEAISGIRIGARKSDGAVLGFGYCSIGQGPAGESRAVAKFVADAKSAGDVLERSSGVKASYVCVVDRAGVNETIEGHRIVSVEHLATAVGAVAGPDMETIVAAAEKAGITLSREQLRAVERRQGGTKRSSGGKKVVHNGRVTKVEK